MVGVEIPRQVCWWTLVVGVIGRIRRFRGRFRERGSRGHIGGRSAILRARSGRERGSGKRCGLVLRCLECRASSHPGDKCYGAGYSFTRPESSPSPPPRPSFCRCQSVRMDQRPPENCGAACPPGDRLLSIWEEFFSPGSGSA